MLDPQRLASLIHLGELAESKVSEVMDWYGIINYFSAGFHTMLPKSSESASGAISVWQWVKMGWNYKSTPAFNPLQVFLLTFTCLPGIFDIGLQIIKSKCESNCKSSPLLRNIKDFNITKRLLAVPVVPYFASKIKMLANLLSILSLCQIQQHFSLNWAVVSVNFYWLFFTHSALSLGFT